MRIRKDKIINILRTGVFLLINSFLLYNCSQEEQVIDGNIIEEDFSELLFKSITIKESKKYFENISSSHNKTFARIDNNIELKANLDEIYQEPFMETDQKITVIPAVTKYPNIDTQILLVKSLESDEVYTLLYNQIIDENRVDKTKFSGTITLTDIDGKFVDGYRIKNDITITKFTSDQPISNRTDCDEALDPNSDFCNDELDEVVISSNNSNTAQNNHSVPCTRSSIAYCQTFQRYINNSYYGYAQGYMNYARQQIRKSFYEKINDEELKGKAKCLNDKLKEEGDDFLLKILSKFQGKSEFDINIKSVDKIYRTGTTIELNGLTTYTKGSNLINIKISTNKLSDMSALAAVRTLIHEYIHADMYRKINTTNYDGDLDFKTTYEKYKKEQQHNTMADLYVNSMSNALKDFHKNVLTVDYNKFVDYFGSSPSDAFYEALAWQGLKEANVEAYNNLSDHRKTVLNNEANKIGLLTKNCPK